MQVVSKGERKIYKQSGLGSKFILTNVIEHAHFQERVEVEMQKNQYKLFGSVSAAQIGI